MIERINKEKDPLKAQYLREREREKEREKQRERERERERERDSEEMLGEGRGV